MLKMEHDVIAHVVQDVFGGQIATPADCADAEEDDLHNFGVTIDNFPLEAFKEC